MDKTYNGWANRETWLVNLHFGEGIQDMLQESVHDEYIDKDTSYTELADMIEGYVDAIIDEDIEAVTSASPFLSDFIDLGRIDYYDIAKTYEADLEYLEEEEEE